MKRFFGLLNLLLCFELIVSPIAPSLSFVGQKAFAQSDCGTGFVWDSTLNRCLTSAETANVMNAVSQCPQGDVKCYRQNAEDALKKKEDSGEAPKAVADKKGIFNSTVMKAGAIAVPLTMAIAGLKSSGPKGACTAPSYYALVGGGAAAFAGDMLANMGHKKRLKKIEEDWNKIISPDASKETDKDNIRANGTEAQSQAFEMLARAEDSLASAAKLKSTTYMIAMGAFAAGAALAALEFLMPNGGICKVSSTSSNFDKIYNVANIKSEIQKLYNISQARNFAEFYILNQELNSSNVSASLDDYVKIEKYTQETKIENDTVFKDIKKLAIKLIVEMSFVNSAHAIPPVPEDTVSQTVTKTGGIGKFLTSPVTRIAIGGILAGWSMIMYKHAKSQAEASKNRAELLRKMRDEFKTASGAIAQCVSADRSDPSKPNCYCYTPEGQHNTERANSQVCQKLFNGKLATAGNYFGVAASQMKGCIDSNRDYDEACKCKVNNSCMKAISGNFQGVNPGTMSMLSSSLAPVGQLANGNMDTANVDTAALGNNAARILDATEKLAAKNGILDKVNKAGLEFQDSAIAASAGMPSNLLSSNSSSLPLNPKDAATMLQKDLDSLNIGPVSGTKNTIAGPETSKTEQLEFGVSSDQLAAQETQVAEVMKENLDYGQNDINKGSDTNLFEVLSNRYQRSGMRRLFDEKGQTQADKPAKDDIVK